jgi:translation elongation factor EF-1alpha
VKSVKKVRKVQARKTVRRAKPISAARKTAIVRAAKKVKEKLLGKVVHFYDHISVAIVDVASPIHLGDTVTFKRGDMKLTQRVDSMQINHQPVTEAKKGDVIGVKVKKQVKEGAKVVA